MPDECEVLPSGRLYVDHDAVAGGNDGSSWTDAYLELAEALQFTACPSTAITEIWVAQGVYTPDPTGLSNPRAAAFQLMNGLAIYGGFPAGGGEGTFEVRDPALYETTLTGDIGVPGDSGDNCYHVFYHPGGLNLDATAVLDGFTVTSGNANGNGSGRYGGSMYNNRSSPTVTNCTFTGNSAGFGGGGMSNYDSDPTVTNCTFTGNSAHDGGGMYNRNYSDPTVTNCTFTGNSAGYDGGGMYNHYSSPTLANCTFSGNPAGDYGGGMYNQSSSPTLANCTFSGNPAGDYGGGMYNQGSDSTVTNCTFTGNSADRGGGMYNHYSSPTLANCTFSANSAGYYGGGMYNYNYSDPTVTNCILWGDTPNEISRSSFSYPDVTYSCIQGGYSGEGNIDVDPRFVDYGYWDDNSTPEEPNDDFWVGGDYHLQSDSRCIDVGDNQAVPDDATTDFDGEERIQHCRGDLGADEAPYWAADCNGNGVGDACDLALGTSEDCNGNEVPDDCEPGGLEDCSANGNSDLCDIFAGTSPDCNGNAVPDECEALSTLYVDRNAVGGTGYGSSWADAYLELHEALRFAHCTANLVTEIWVAHGVYTPDPTGLSNPRAAAFQLMNGLAIYGGFPAGGGDETFEVRNPAVYETTLTGDIGVPGDSGDNCYHVFYHPGGLSLDATAILDGFTVTSGNANGNGSSGYGGSMFNDRSSPTVTNCTLTGNSAHYGGGMYNFTSDPTVTNCTFTGNSAGEYGGGMYNSYYSDPTVTNCTVTGNSAGYYGGAMYGSYGSNPTVTNCILWGDTPSEIYAPHLSAYPDVTYSCIQGGYAGEGNIDADPRFVDYGHWDDHGTPEKPGDDLWADGDYHLQAGSACIDAGDNAAVPPEVTTDLEGNPRITDGDGNGVAAVDMGAYEAPTSPLITDLDVIPGVCPNFWDPAGEEALRAAIVGVEWLDARKIDPDSLFLVRADGIGEAVPPLGGTGPSIKDLAGPREDGADECSGSGPDGILDLEIQFEAEKVMDGLKLGDMPADARIYLTLRGALLDGTRFEAYDYVVIVDPPPYLPTPPPSLLRSTKTVGSHGPVRRTDAE